MNQLVATVDITAIVQRVDVNQIVQQVDVDEVIRKVDVEAVVDRVDVDGVVDRIDIDALVEQTDLGAVIAASSSGVASDALDVVRSRAVGLDEFIAGHGRVMTARAGDAAPPGPPVIRESLQGKYAGLASRFTTFAVDVGSVSACSCSPLPLSRSRPG